MDQEIERPQDTLTAVTVSRILFFLAFLVLSEEKNISRWLTSARLGLRPRLEVVDCMACLGRPGCFQPWRGYCAFSSVIRASPRVSISPVSPELLYRGLA